MEQQVIISKVVEDQIFELGCVLYEKNYFGFLENSFEYAEKIKKFIYTIPSLTPRNCKNTKYGKFFVRYDNKTSKMKYFITFDRKGDRFLVRHIIFPKTKEYDTIIP
jgi:hypothetical protein